MKNLTVSNGGRKRLRINLEPGYRVALSGVFFVLLLLLAGTAFAQPKMTVAWTFQPGQYPQDGFTIERGPGPLTGTTTFKEIAKVAATVRSYVDTVVTGQEYCYKVIAYSKYGKSSSTPVCTMATVSPGQFNTSAVSTGAVTIVEKQTAATQRSAKK